MEVQSERIEELKGELSDRMDALTAYVRKKSFQVKR